LATTVALVSEVAPVELPTTVLPAPWLPVPELALAGEAVPVVLVLAVPVVLVLAVPVVLVVVVEAVPPALVLPVVSVPGVEPLVLFDDVVFCWMTLGLVPL
jgi:hypothetical protein